MAIVLDTHAAIWYLSNSTELSPSARNAIDETLRVPDDLLISVISLVEIIYLAEKGRIPPQALQMLESALGDEASGMVVVPLDAAIAQTLHRISRSTVPDMPDRIIAATAAHGRHW